MDKSIYEMYVMIWQVTGQKYIDFTKYIIHWYEYTWIINVKKKNLIAI